MPHYLHMFKFMMLFASCFTMGKAHRGNTGNVGLTSTIVSSEAQNAPQHGLLTYTMRLDLDMSQRTR
jgi:hypothetical protein